MEEMNIIYLNKGNGSNPRPLISLHANPQKLIILGLGWNIFKKSSVCERGRAVCGRADRHVSQKINSEVSWLCESWNSSSAWRAVSTFLSSERIKNISYPKSASRLPRSASTVTMK